MIKNLTFHSLILLALASLLYLGYWQLHRLEWKTELLSTIKDGQAEDYIEYPFGVKDNEFSYKKSFLSGKIDQSKELYFFNINSYGQSGYNIIVPLATKDKTVYIDLGWTNFTNINYENFTFRSLVGELDLKGILIYSKKRRAFSPQPDTVKNNWYLMNIEEMDQYTGLNSEKYIFRVLDQEYYSDLLNEFTSVNIPNNHLQYAITWFALALSIAGMYITYIYKNILKK